MRLGDEARLSESQSRDDQCHDLTTDAETAKKLKERKLEKCLYLNYKTQKNK